MEGPVSTRISDEAISLRKKIIDLESKLSQVELERDDLARDVEALCMETTANTSFNMSSVLSERIFVAGACHLRTCISNRT